MLPLSSFPRRKQVGSEICSNHSNLEKIKGKHERECNEEIFDMIRQKEWRKFRKMLKSTAKRKKIIDRTKNWRDDMHRNILHILCEHQPPHDIAKKVIDIFPQFAAATDKDLRTPLHVAIVSVTNIFVVECLLASHLESGEMMDVAGRTPLSLAAEKSNLEVVRVLILLHPHVITMEDNQGMTPLEHAIVSEAPMSVVKRLQIATVQRNSRKAEVVGN